MLSRPENSRSKIIGNNFNAISSTKSGQFRYFSVKSVSWGLTVMLMYVANGLVIADANPSAFIIFNHTQADAIILFHLTRGTYWPSIIEHSWQHLGLFHNVGTLQIFSRNLWFAEILLLMKISSRIFVRVPKSMLWAQVQIFSLLEIFTIHLISGVVYIREIILESPRNDSERLPWSHDTTWPCHPQTNFHIPVTTQWHNFIYSW